MDRLLYLEIVHERESLTSLQMTSEILTLEKKGRKEEITEKEIENRNPNINKRLRDLNRLGILDDKEGEYSLSPIGFLILDELKRLKLNIRVLHKHRHFFDDHDYTVIPSQQFREIHKLQYAEQCKDALEYGKIIEENTAKTRHKIRIVTDRLHDIPGWIRQELREGHLALDLVYQFRKPFEKNSDDQDEQELWNEIVLKDLPTVELRYLSLEDRNPIGIRIIDEDWAILNFFNISEGILDRSKSFHGIQVQFVHWVENLFSSIWSFSKELEVNNL